MLSLPEADRCCWPLDDEHWCGQPVADRQPYCAKHREAARERLRAIGPLERLVLKLERRKTRLVDQNTWRRIVRN